MADPDAYPVIFMRAVAQHMEDSNLGVYRSDGTSYLPAERGIFTNGPTLPTTLDNCIVLSWLEPIADGRANMLYRLQAMSRVKGTMTAAQNLAWLIRTAFDHKENVPAGFHVSWVELFAELAFTADASGRCATSQTLHFRGRRPLA